jgi:hypothetical protein
MYLISFLSDVFPVAARLRPFRFVRTHPLMALVIIVVGLGISALVGFWAGKVAEGKGREFGAYFALGFLLTICGIIPGLIVVIITYVLKPAPGYRAQAPQPPPGP